MIRRIALALILVSPIAFQPAPITAQAKPGSAAQSPSAVPRGFSATCRSPPRFGARTTPERAT